MAKLNNILFDGYDREVFEARMAKDSSFEAVRTRAGRLLPHPTALIQDVFCALYKLNVVLEPPEEISASVFVQRRLVESVLNAAGIHELKKRTELDPLRAASATVVLVNRMLSALTREYRLGPKTLLEIADVAHDAETLEARRKELDHLETLPDDAFPPDERESLEESLEEEKTELAAKIAVARREQEKLAKNLSTEIEDVVQGKVQNLPSQMDDVESQLDNLGLGKGAGLVSREKRLELGERLLENKKLVLLAKLVGAFREVAFETRRKRVHRAPQELHSVSTGKDIERLLPSELFYLDKDHPTLHREFLRKYGEGQLLAYHLESPASRGPIVVCLDGSGSMQGSKELWAKAVALTLMEIARRERRRCLGIIFSSGQPLFEVEFLATSKKSKGRARIREEDVMRFAEFFPGGGTDFGPPLERAVDAVSEGSYRRGDIIFITDGQASVSDALLRRIAEKRKKHRFKIRGILVDMESNAKETLERFSDDVRLVTDLAKDSLTDLFAAI